MGPKLAGSSNDAGEMKKKSVMVKVQYLRMTKHFQTDLDTLVKYLKDAK